MSEQTHRHPRESGGDGNQPLSPLAPMRARGGSGRPANAWVGRQDALGLVIETPPPPFPPLGAGAA